jgi:hypothetical protein
MADLLKEGDVFELEIGDRVYTELPAHMWPKNMSRGSGESLVCDWGLSNCEVEIGIPLRGGPSDFMAGKYVVTGTKISPASPPGSHDPFPEGYKVFAQHVEHPKLCVSFYQAGCGANERMRNKKAIGRARARWEVQDSISAA